ncbi:ATP-binding protein [Deinococcus deserti]|uniref:histidine kinase n=1 Tax=Deinococcus deserti (strain DSM 17065 / CIP 109153 / LMG 22923 / VCD115) TaxID=546414 RepID=C1D2Y8_DEIDV|nr:ATP-binding protein [Deinococcus deserti]ACO47777.2 putative histidine kinase, classic [Deinococcus deserti VCD115]
MPDHHGTLAPPTLSERLQEVTEALAATRMQEGVFEVILKPAREALDARAATVLLAGSEGLHLERVAMTGQLASSPSIWQGAMLEDDGPAADALAQRRALFFEHEGELARKYPSVEARSGATAPVVATAVLPMFLDGRPLGVLVLDFMEPHRFTEDEKRFLRTLAAQCAIAFGRARLLRDLETRVSERTHQLESQNDVLEAQHAELTLRSDALRMANEELDAFAMSVSHDLRAPLRHITGFLGLLRRSLDAPLNEKSERYLNLVDEAATRMNTLIDAMLDLSRTSRQTLRLTQVNVGDLLASVQTTLQPDTAQRRVTWTVGPLPVVTADADLLRQVLVNLLSNALKYSQPREETHITVAAQERPGEWVFQVTDNGVGFDPRYADKLFNVFQRLHRPDAFEGIGVGLANVRRIILRHGGRVWAESQEEQGATFSFSLPRGREGR